jgi:hypothetical protein
MFMYMIGLLPALLAFGGSAGFCFCDTRLGKHMVLENFHEYRNALHCAFSCLLYGLNFQRSDRRHNTHVSLFMKEVMIVRE